MITNFILHSYVTLQYYDNLNKILSYQNGYNKVKHVSIKLPSDQSLRSN